MSIVRLAIGLLAISPAIGAAQSDPPARFLSATAYDQVRHRLVLFGGLQSGDQVLNDTWEWDGTRWLQLSPPVTPPARAGHSMAFDPVRRVVLLFGGAGDDEPLGDLWVFNGTTWKAVTAEPGPMPRIAAQMIWNPDRQAIQLFGGQATAGRMNDLWEWNGARWTLLSGSATPSADLPNRAVTSARSAQVRADLRNLVTAQEAFFSDHSRYAEDLAEITQYGFAAGEDLTIVISRPDENNWSATATHAKVKDGDCMIYIGTRPPSFPEDLAEGEPRCIGFK